MILYCTQSYIHLKRCTLSLSMRAFHVVSYNDGLINELYPGSFDTHPIAYLVVVVPFALILKATDIFLAYKSK